MSRFLSGGPAILGCHYGVGRWEQGVGAVVHGRPGQSLQEPDEWAWSGTTAARRGAFFEQRVAQVLHRWLAARSDEVHVFHDLVGLNNLASVNPKRKLKPVSLGGSNIDHLVLAGDDWLMIDAKGCGAGSLEVHQGKGVLVREDGTRSPQPWMDDHEAYSRAGAPFRLTDKGGVAVWVVPQTTAFDHTSFLTARFLDHKKARLCVLTDAEVDAGALDAELPVPAAPADPRDVERLHRYVSAPDVLYRLDANGNPTDVVADHPVVRP